MENERGRPILQEMFGKIDDDRIWTVGLIKDSNLTIGTFIRPGECSRYYIGRVNCLNHFIPSERSYSSNGEKRMLKEMKKDKGVIGRCR